MKKSILFLFFSLSVSSLIGNTGLKERMDSLQAYIAIDPVKADSLGRELLAEVREARNIEMYPRIYYLLGVIQYYQGNFLLSINNYKEALNYINAKTQSEIEAAIWNNLGVVYELSENYVEAIDFYQKSLTYAINKSDSLSIFQSRLNLGLLYTKVADYESSEAYLLDAYRYFSATQDPYNTALALQNMGILYKTTNRDTEAKKCFKDAIDIVQTLDNPVGLASLYNDYLYYLLLIEDYQTFETELPVFNDLLSKINNEYLEAAANATKGYYVYSRKKNYAEARDLFLSSIEVFSQYEAVQTLEDIYPKLANCYFRLGQPDLASEWLDKFIVFLSKKYADESAEKIAELRAVHEVEQQKTKTLLLQNKITQQKKNTRFWIVLSLIFIVSSIITTYLLITIRKKEKKLVLSAIELNSMVNQEENAAKEKNPEDKPVLDQQEALSKMQFNQLFARIKRYVVNEEKYLDPNLKIIDIASALGTNERYISQALSEGGNTRFNSFINFYRINRAKSLLRNSHNITIGEVATRSGFSNQSSFQRKFKELTGVTPLTFQRIAATQKFNSEEE